MLNKNYLSGEILLQKRSPKLMWLNLQDNRFSSVLDLRPVIDWTAQKLKKQTGFKDQSL